MSLEEYERDMTRCSRCSYCKFVPHVKWKNWDTAAVCPSISRYHFHSWAAGGKMITGLALLRGRIDYSDTLLDIVYQCCMDGACDVSCKNQRDLEPLEMMLALRAKLVEDGQLHPAHMVAIDGLKKEDNMLQQKKSDRGRWAEGLDVKDLTKEKADVLYHAGCRLSFDEELWDISRGAIAVMKKAGVDVGIMGKDEVCCGGRAYEMGYQGELTKYAEHNLDVWKNAGVKTVVTSCAEGYQAFKVLYDKIGKKPPVKILHITEFIEQLIEEGTLKLENEVPMTVTYHDPCHLGRLAEPWIHWEGVEKKVMGQMIVHDPPKVYRRGANGVYDTPRNILQSIPGVKLLEMDRIREYAWCCGAGGGVIDAYPDFAQWTANERLKEAEGTGAEAIVSACSWCERNFLDTVKENGNSIQVLDIIQLVQKALV